MGAFEPRWSWQVYAGPAKKPRQRWPFGRPPRWPKVRPLRPHQLAALERACALAWLRFAPHLKIADAERGCGARRGVLYDRIRRDPQLRLELDRLRAAGGKPMHWRRRNNLDRQARERQMAINA